MGKMIDPPSGWRYGFPKELPKEVKTGDINDWLVTEGYPKEIIEELGEYFHFRIWETEPELKSLEQHNSERIQGFSIDLSQPKKNGIACPTCGEELYDSNPMVTLTSFPAQKNIHCEKCNYSGYRIA